MLQLTPQSRIFVATEPVAPTWARIQSSIAFPSPLERSCSLISASMTANTVSGCTLMAKKRQTRSGLRRLGCCPSKCTRTRRQSAAVLHLALYKAAQLCRVCRSERPQNCARTCHKGGGANRVIISTTHMAR
jgi:hypothetical protein